MSFDVEHIFQSVVDLLRYDSASPLVFHSGLFPFLFAAFALGYALLNRATTSRILYVILFSLYFYYKSSGIYFFLLIFVSVCDYLFARRMAATESKSKRRWWVAASVATNLGLLAYFKYTNFLIEISQNLFGAGFLDFQNIFLPVGISFIVFQSMSYTIDIYRGNLRPLDNYFDYLFYLSFFPQIVAGPIVRASDFIPQIRRPLAITREMFGLGVGLIVVGLVKKAIIADYISICLVDPVFANPGDYSGFESLVALYGYALQIYCDFSGYSDMAIGIALMLGFRFPKNFDAPYKSATITEFWRRWHISLSSWLRDYLYISLGGNRKGRIRQYFNLFITMLLGGLWHGAALRFVLWGALHGVALALHKVWLMLVPGAKMLGSDMKPLWRVLGVIFTFHIVCLGWLLFRAENMDSFMAILNRITHHFMVDGSLFMNMSVGTTGAFVEQSIMILWCALLGLGFAMHMLPKRWCDGLYSGVIRSGFVGQVLLLVVTIWLVMQFNSYFEALTRESNVVQTVAQPFIYFQF